MTDKPQMANRRPTQETRILKAAEVESQTGGRSDGHKRENAAGGIMDWQDGTTTLES